MEIRVLKYFIAIASEENMSTAAEQLFITQPTLSRQIMELEAELGKKLFTRGKRNHKMTLTEDGLLLFRRAEEIIALVGKTTAELLADNSTICGDIYIGGGETDAMRLLAKAAKALQHNFPLIKYHIYSGNADDVTEKLDKGLLDLGLLIEPSNIEKYDYTRLPVADQWGLLMRKDSPLASKDFITAKDIKDLPLIMSRQSLVRNKLSGWSNIKYEELNIVATYNLLYNASIMVSEGIGYAMSLDKLADTSSQSPLTFKPLLPNLQAHVNIVWKKYQSLSKPAQLFLRTIKDIASQKL